MTQTSEAEAVEAWMIGLGFRPERRAFGNWTGYVDYDEDQPEFVSDRQALIFYRTVKQAELKARFDEWREVLGREIDGLAHIYPVDNYNDFVSVPSFFINKRLAELQRLQKGAS